MLAETSTTLKSRSSLTSSSFSISIDNAPRRTRRHIHNARTATTYVQEALVHTLIYGAENPVAHRVGDPELCLWYRSITIFSRVDGRLFHHHRYWLTLHGLSNRQLCRLALQPCSHPLFYLSLSRGLPDEIYNSLSMYVSKSSQTCPKIV
jgi:hypothetical protein